MFQLLFPQYKNRGWVYIPLGSLALAEQKPGRPNPLLDPVYCQRWVKRLHRRYRASYSFGGWFEDRSTLWSGHYMPEGMTYHLGVDFCVPERSRVYSPTSGTIVTTWHDPDPVGGWGGLIVIQIKPHLHLLLAHLGKIFAKSNSQVAEGQVLGTVGGAPNNGNWFPHLHAQLVRGKFVFANNCHIDGYGEFSVKNQRRFPDPFTVWPAVH